MSTKREVDPDPSPANMVVTDFSEIWKLRSLLVADPLLPEPEPEFTRHEVERVERQVTVTRTLGRRSWTETSTVTVYRSVKP